MRGSGVVRCAYDASKDGVFGFGCFGVFGFEVLVFLGCLGLKSKFFGNLDREVSKKI